MAVWHETDGRDPYVYTEHEQTQPPIKLATLTNIAGGVVSLALIAGICFWGYKLVMRDVTGIPVVRAVEGEMRVRPAEPGGQLAQNQGLAVNAVAAEGEAEPPASTITLAPPPVELTAEDKPRAAATVELPEPLNLENEFDDASIVALAEQIADGIEPLAVNEAEPLSASAEETDTPQVVNAPGLKASLRPQLRPGTALAARAAPDTPAKEIDVASLPLGTRLVQLGAYESPEVARAEWARLETRFGDYLAGKDRIVQEAQSGGRTFYRLRAVGFSDLSDARRFCSALVAEGADCIPVVTR
ncbi:MAG: SPOR domain-containing protein [Pseudomonadota bacterium]